MSYYGSYDHTVDPKGRVVVPALFRDEFRTPMSFRDAATALIGFS